MGYWAIKPEVKRIIVLEAERFTVLVWLSKLVNARAGKFIHSQYFLSIRGYLPSFTKTANLASN